MSFFVLAVCLLAWKLSGGAERELKVAECVAEATWTQSPTVFQICLCSGRNESDSCC